MSMTMQLDYVVGWAPVGSSCGLCRRVSCVSRPPSMVGLFEVPGRKQQVACMECLLRGVHGELSVLKDMNTTLERRNTDLLCAFDKLKDEKASYNAAEEARNHAVKAAEVAEKAVSRAETAMRDALESEEALRLENKELRARAGKFELEVKLLRERSSRLSVVEQKLEAEKKRVREMESDARDRETELGFLRSGLESKEGEISARHARQVKEAEAVVREEARRAKLKLEQSKREASAAREALEKARESCALSEAREVKVRSDLDEETKRHEATKLAVLRLRADMKVLERRAKVATSVSHALSSRDPKKMDVLKSAMREMNAVMERERGKEACEQVGVCVWKACGGSSREVEASRIINLCWRDVNHVVDVLCEEGIVFVETESLRKKKLELEDREVAETKFSRMLRADQGAVAELSLFMQTKFDMTLDDAMIFSTMWGASDSASVPVPLRLFKEMCAERGLTRAEADWLLQQRPRGQGLVATLTMDELVAKVSRKTAMFPVCLSKAFARSVLDAAVESGVLEAHPSVLLHPSAPPDDFKTVLRAD